jgi:hypothetical protein
VFEKNWPETGCIEARSEKKVAATKTLIGDAMVFLQKNLNESDGISFD